MGVFVPLLTLGVATVFSAWLINAIQPLLQRYAVATPNARSSHRTPTPQGAGLAVIAAALTVGGVAILFSHSAEQRLPVAAFIATIFIAAVGAIDDLKPISVLPRLIAHAVAVGGILLSLPDGLQIFPFLPLWVERGLLCVAGVWFVNLVNFMDGLDWMTVVEVTPIAVTLVVLGIFSHLQPSTALTMAALGGAMVGFAPFNRPVAKMFLGDVGSLPIGLLLGWALLELAIRGHMIPALLLPLYYLGDATVTILRRALHRECIWTAHRTHFYQRATDNGLTVMQVVRTVFVLNVLLSALAGATFIWTGQVAQFTFLSLGSAAVVAILLRFGRSREIPVRQNID